MKFITIKVDEKLDKKIEKIAELLGTTPKALVTDIVIDNVESQYSKLFESGIFQTRNPNVEFSVEPLDKFNPFLTNL